MESPERVAAAWGEILLELPDNEFLELCKEVASQRKSFREKLKALYLAPGRL